MRLIICGGRDFQPELGEVSLTKHILRIWKVTEVVSGGCDGADKFGEQMARECNIPVKHFIPDWVFQGKKAGPLRNEEMAKYADGCLAFPGGRGTEDMVQRAKRHGLRVFRARDYK